MIMPALIIALPGAAVLLGIISAGIYISIVEPSGPAEQMWQQEDALRR
jgi:hypothetical protein